jgi:predicted MFS family arabinose efflux permease
LRLQNPTTIVLVVCAAEILSMTPFSMFLALQPVLRDTWQLSNTASGWISSAYSGGYMLAVPVLSSVTDRVDARNVWLGACGMAALGAVGFALLADGTWTASAFQVIAGAGLAGTYMPGLKVIADRLDATPRPRHVAFYTTSFTIGSSVSFWLVGMLAATMSWRMAVMATAVGPALGCTLVGAVLRSAAKRPPQSSGHGHWMSVLRSGDTMRYVIGYSAHVWELFALRAWVVPFVTFVAAAGAGAPPLSAATIAAIVGLIGVPASLAGAELIGRHSRRRIIVTVMLVSVALSYAVMPATRGPWIVIILVVCAYSALISADSAALTSGVLDVAPPASRGTAMAVYSTLGFAAATAGAFAVGAVLDLLGGQSSTSWMAGFVIMAVPNLLGAYVVGRASR